jgi:hypothetical protein
VHVYKIKFDFKNLPKGGEIDIAGLEGIFENGKTYKVSDAAAEAYRVYHQAPVVSEVQGGPVQWDLGRSLLDAFKDVDGVTVEAVKEEGGNS